MVFLWGAVGSLYAQEREVSGTVIDSQGVPVPGVNIVIKASPSVGVISDMDGQYQISVPDENTVLVFSFIGFQVEEIPVSGRSVIDVTMREDMMGLDEVVVVGYGVQKRSDVTGSMVSVGEEELNVRPVSNALEALQGRAAGVDITSNERPGEIGNITIRGMRSMVQNSSGDYIGNTPLYVVDGIPLMSSSAIETLNPRDIESIDILKDASATAIYGSRGANGVVLVTTKKGKAGQLNINYAGTLTTETIQDKAPMMNASDYITWRRWAYHNMDPEAYPRGDQLQ
ncbi:TonB-dependent receptor [Geofilum rubicundum JCM 15548]|uniref:TonB-dependent receptor n=2 Tax=Geofilum TaxID=1236988 RepID=A0A0E9LV67_9BACT|nr:TonB-dependent receptor [Geofilum rubicundum JCM 15548]